MLYSCDMGAHIEESVPLFGLQKQIRVIVNCRFLDFNQLSSLRHYPANTTRLPNVWPMLGQRRRRWANIGRTFGRCVVCCVHVLPRYYLIKKNSPYYIVIIKLIIVMYNHFKTVINISLFYWPLIMIVSIISLSNTMQNQSFLRNVYFLCISLIT